MHSPDLTVSFWRSIRHEFGRLYPRHPLTDPDTVPQAEQWGFTPWPVRQHLSQTVDLADPLVFIGFSAGVVGAIAAAWAWQRQGGTIRAFMALDGWGVPLAGSFPIYRFSHDAFTHWSSQPLGIGQQPFYADPGVAHLDLWRSPHQVWGWRVYPSHRVRMTAAEALCRSLAHASDWPLHLNAG